MFHLPMYLSVHSMYRYVEAMRPEISDETKEMVETSAEEILDNPALSTDDLTFDQKTRMICTRWFKEKGRFKSNLDVAPWNK